MTAPHSPCPDRTVLSQYASGEIDAVSRAALTPHVDGCPSCLMKLNAAAAPIGAAGMTQISSGPTTEQQSSLPPTRAVGASAQGSSDPPRVAQAAPPTRATGASPTPNATANATLISEGQSDRPPETLASFDSNAPPTIAEVSIHAAAFATVDLPASTLRDPALEQAVPTRPDAALSKAHASARSTPASTTNDVAHIRIHAFVQAAAALMHWVLGGLFVQWVLTPDSSDSDAGINGGVEAIVTGWMLIVLGWLMVGALWAPFNAWALFTRKRFGRVSTIAYSLFSAVTCFGIFYAIYAVWSLTRPGVRVAFGEPAVPRGPRRV